METHEQYTAYIGFGANLGDREATFHRVIAWLESHERVAQVVHSSLYETAPVGGPAQSDYLNAVISIQTTMPAQVLLGELLAMEQRCGRVRTEYWGPRTVDLDLLVMGDLILEEETPHLLYLPHPRLHLRRFVLVPLAELAPELFHPQFGRSIRELLVTCSDASAVLPFGRRKSPQVGK